jgi:hypothetical protein
MYGHAQHQIAGWVQCLCPFKGSDPHSTVLPKNATASPARIPPNLFPQISTAMHPETRVSGGKLFVVDGIMIRRNYLVGKWCMKGFSMPVFP